MNKQKLITPFDFFIKTFLQNKQLFFWALVVSFIFSALFVNYQKKNLRIIKSLVPVSNMSEISAILKKTNQDAVKILEEYVYILKRGLPKSEFFEVIKKNQDINEDQIENMYATFLEFRNHVTMDKMRLYRKYPMYVMYYDVILDNKDQENFLKVVTKTNDYLVKNLNILDELVKNRVISFYVYNFEINKIDEIYSDNSKIDVHQFKVDGTESVLITKNIFKISEKHLEKLKDFFKKNQRPLIEGIDAYDYKIEKTKFIKITSVSILISLVFVYLFCFLRLKKTQ